MNFGVEFQVPTYNVAHRVSPWIKWSYLPAFLALVPVYGIAPALIAVALALKGVADMPYARRLAWGMAAVPLAVALISLASGTLILLNAGPLSSLTLELRGGVLPSKIWFVVLMLSAFLLSVTIHEPAHAMVSYWFGDTTAQDHGRLNFNPVSHINPVTTVLFPAVSLLIGSLFFGWASTPVSPSRMHPRPWGYIGTSLAGPLSNVLMAGASWHAFLMAMMIAGTDRIFEGAGSWFALPEGDLSPWILVAFYLKMFSLLNIWLFVFNMLPIPGFDGGNALLELLPEETAMSMRRNSMMISLIFLAVLLSTPMGSLLGDSIEFFAHAMLLGMSRIAGFHVVD